MGQKSQLIGQAIQHHDKPSKKRNFPLQDLKNCQKILAINTRVFFFPSRADPQQGK